MTINLGNKSQNRVKAAANRSIEVDGPVQGNDYSCSNVSFIQGFTVEITFQRLKT